MIRIKPVLSTTVRVGVDSRLTPDVLHVAIHLIRRTSVQPIENVERIAAMTLAHFFHRHDWLFTRRLAYCDVQRSISA